MAPRSLPRRGFLGVALGVLAAACGGAAPTAAPELARRARPAAARDPRSGADSSRSRACAGSSSRGRGRSRPCPGSSRPSPSSRRRRTSSRFGAAVGFDLRQIPEAAVAALRGGGRGRGLDALLGPAQRRPRGRRAPLPRPADDRASTARSIGPISSASAARSAATPATLALLGRDVAAFQLGGSPTRGPARIAALYATDKLKKSPTVLSPRIRCARSTSRLGPAPFRAFAVGPFEGELARGARGLLAGATAIGGTVRPSAREGLLVVIAVAGDFSRSGEPASRELAAAWDELAAGSFGRLIGLDEADRDAARDPRGRRGGGGGGDRSGPPGEGDRRRDERADRGDHALRLTSASP